MGDARVIGNMGGWHQHVHVVIEGDDRGDILLTQPVDANILFLKLTPERMARLQNAGVGFYSWGGQASDEIRLVVSWDQPQTQVDQLCVLLESL